MIVIGPSEENGIWYVHKDNNDLVRCVLTIGNIDSSGTTNYYSGNSKNDTRNFFQYHLDMDG